MFRSTTNRKNLLGTKTYSSSHVVTLGMFWNYTVKIDFGNKFWAVIFVYTYIYIYKFMYVCLWTNLFKTLSMCRAWKEKLPLTTPEQCFFRIFVYQEFRNAAPFMVDASLEEA